MEQIQFTEKDKQAIRENQQRMVNLLGTNELGEIYDEISCAGDYDRLFGISPIFERLNSALENAEDDEDEDAVLDNINEVDQEIMDFLDTLPALPVNLDFDTFYERYKDDDSDFFCDYTDNYSFSDLFNVLLETKNLTKAEKEKIISVITNELRQVLR